jgi:hypothetical protein
MSFPPAPPSLLGNGNGHLPEQTAPRNPILDPDFRERRYSPAGCRPITREKVAAVLESWDLQAMHALSSGEVRFSLKIANKQSIAQVKLRMMKAMVETTSHSWTVDNGKATAKEL